jgi:hypothetical protein
LSERVDTNAVMREGNDHLSGNPSLAPRSGQPFTEMTDLAAAQAAATEPEKAEPIRLAPIAHGEWRFVTVDGRAGATVTLNLPHLNDDIDDNVKRKNIHKRWVDRKIKQTKEGRLTVGMIYPTDVGKDGMLKADKAVFDLLGEYHLVFTPARDLDGRRRKIAEFVTRDKVVADYIRLRLSRGEFAGEFFEDVRPMTVEVNGQFIQVMPADDTARQAMAAAAAGD